jgi:flavoprotein
MGPRTDKSIYSERREYMSFKEWSQQQSQVKRFGDMLIETFKGCSEVELNDVDFVIDKLLSKYGEEAMQWIYSLNSNVRQQGWERFKRVWRYECYE